MGDLENPSELSTTNASNADQLLEAPAMSTNKRKFKVVCVGDMSVGKTTFIHKLTNSSEITTAFDVFVDNETFVVELWDPAGQERFK
eukprot:TRINITY_DN33963_c0_g1_i2.p1 TRINITY_DN33963_c0_g1~~TRINITY_DN33963_c0_g1_i2.p1  ORF type:complete len:102 (-),score=21.16 TRINITY_DN33963_c0_g1_i2:71-331(-)